MGDAIKKAVPPEGVPDAPGKGSKPRKNKGFGEKPKPFPLIQGHRCDAGPRGRWVAGY